MFLARPSSLYALLHSAELIRYGPFQLAASFPCFSVSMGVFAVIDLTLLLCLFAVLSFETYLVMYTSSLTSSSKSRSILLFDLDADSFVKFAQIEADVSYTDTIA